MIGRKIMEECLVRFLANKTRLLVTHAAQYCRYMDRIIIMENGQVIANDTYAGIQKNIYYQRQSSRLFKQQE